MKMNPFDAYKIYTGVKLHFNSGNYDYFKYHGSVKAKIESFEKRKDLYFFEKAAHTFDKETFLHRNLIQVRINQSSEYWIRDLFSSQNDTEYFKWKSYIDSYDVYFKNELSFIKNYLLLNEDKSFADLFISKNGIDSVFIKWIVSRQISEEMVLAFQKAMNCFTITGLNESKFYEDVFMYYQKYTPFVIDYIPEKKILRKIINDMFLELKD